MHLSRIGLMQPDARQAPFLEYRYGEWRVWLAYNPSGKPHLFGTYLSIQPDGAVLRITTDHNTLPTNVVVISEPWEDYYE